MERDKELSKLVNVLRRTSRMALQSEWTGSSEDAARFCVEQYNRVLARLSELEPAVKPLFTPLSDSASAEVIRIATRELLAYFEADEPDFAGAFGKAFYFGCGPRKARTRCMPIAVNYC